MPDIAGGNSSNITLGAGKVLRITSANALSTGIVRRMNQDGGSITDGQTRVKRVSGGASLQFGPFVNARSYIVEAVGERLTYDFPSLSNAYDTTLFNVEPFTGSFTLQNDDIGKVFRCDDASNVTITIPNNLEQGFNCSFVKYAAGNIALALASGTTKVAGGTTLSTLGARGNVVCTKQNAASTATEVIVDGNFV